MLIDDFNKIDESIKNDSNYLLYNLQNNLDNTMNNIYRFNLNAFSNEVIEFMKNNKLITNFYKNYAPYKNTSLESLMYKSNIIMGLLEEDLNNLNYIKFDSSKLLMGTKFAIFEYLSKNNFDIKKANLNPNSSIFSDSSFLNVVIKEDDLSTLEYLKYFKINDLGSKLYNKLIKMNYIYKQGDPVALLGSVFGSSSKENIILENLIKYGDLNIIVNNNITLTDNYLNLFFERINSLGLELDKNKIVNDSIRNSNLLIKYNELEDIIIQDKSIHENSELLKNMPILSKIFGENIAKVIKYHLVDASDYVIGTVMSSIEDNRRSGHEIKLDNIFNNLDPYKFKDIYDKLCKKENKFNSNFDIFFFVKCTEYLANNPNLCKVLNTFDINDDLIKKVSISMNYNKNINNLDELNNVEHLIKEDIDNNYIRRNSYNRRLLKLMFNCTYNEAKELLRSVMGARVDKTSISKNSKLESIYNQNIFNSGNLDMMFPDLTFIQLEYGPDSKEYMVIEEYKNYLMLIAKCVMEPSSITKNYYDELTSKFSFNPLCNLKVMHENILRIFANNYKSHELNMDDLRKRGKVTNINGNTVINIEGEDFVFFSHTDNFHTGESLSDDHNFSQGDLRKNYVCTSLFSKYRYDLGRSDLSFYPLTEASNLIAFGNEDVYIYPTEAPYHTEQGKMINIYDASMMHYQTSGDQASDEYDLLRINSDGTNLQKAFDYITPTLDGIQNITGKTIIKFDPEVHKMYLEKEKQELRSKLFSGTITYKELYILITTNYSSFSYDDREFIEGIINKFNNKEKAVLLNQMEKMRRYSFDNQRERTNEAGRSY